MATGLKTKTLTGQAALDYVLNNPDKQYAIRNYGGIDPKQFSQAQAMRKQQVEQTDQQSRWANQDKGFLGNLAYDLSSPLRLAIEGGANLLGVKPQRAGISATGLLSDNEIQGVVDRPFQTWAGETAKAGSFLLPGLKAANGASAFGNGLIGAAKLGAASQGAYGFGNAIQRPNTDFGQILGETAQNAFTGAAFGAGGEIAGKVLGKGAALVKNGLRDTRLGQGLESFKLKNLGIKTPTTPDGFAVQKELEQNAGRIIDQFGGGQYSPKGLAGAYSNLKGKLAQTAQRSNALLNKDTILQDFVDSAKREVNLTKGTGKENLDLLFNKLDSNSGSLKDMLNLKFELQKELAPAFKKQLLGNPLSDSEQVAMALHNAIDGQIKTASPEIASTLADMAVLHRASPDIVKTAARGINVGVPMSGIKVNVKPVLDAGRNLLSNAANKTGLGSALNRPLSVADLGIAFKSPAAKAAIKSIGLTGATQAANGNVKSPTSTQNFGDIGNLSNSELYQLLTGQGQASQQQQAPTPQALDYETAYQMAVQKYGARNRSEANTIANSLINDSASRIKASQTSGGSASGSVGKVAAKDMANAQSGLSTINDVETLLSSNPNIQLQGLIPDALAPSEVRRFNAAKRNIMDTLARLRTGAAISTREEDLYNSYLPTFYDDPQTVQYKLGLLKQAFGRLTGGQGGNDETNSPIMNQ